MEIKPIDVGGVKLDGNLLLAPLAGYTDFAFRGICVSLGASLAFTEMVSCKGLMYNNENTSVLLTVSEKEKVKAVQIFGNDPSVMRSACESKYLAPFDIVDINMGCPVPKVIKSQAGSFWLKDLEDSKEKIKAIVEASTKPVTAKIRICWDESSINVVETAKMLEKAGVSAIAVHGRTKSQLYAGKAILEYI